MSFPGNDLPGVYAAGAAETLVHAGVKPAERVLMVGAGNIGLTVSYQLKQSGVDVAAVIEVMPQIGGYLVHASKLQRCGKMCIRDRLWVCCLDGYLENPNIQQACRKLHFLSFQC